MFEKFHFKIVTGEDNDGDVVREKVTLPRFKSIPFGLIRKNRSLPEAEQFFALLESVASEEDLAKIDKAPQSEVEKLMDAWQEDSGVSVGGIRGLLEELDGDHGWALVRDLMMVGLRVEDIGTTFDWFQLKAFVQGLTPSDAFFREKHPDWEWDRANMLLADMADSLHWLVWAKTKDGQRNRNQPQPIPRPGVEQPVKRTKGEAIPIDQFKSRMDELRARLRSSTAEESVNRVSVSREKERSGN
ncbi:tail assembly chaperone [Gordonia phage Hexbug]|nr:tail assembly chaperone [Gordonia phage Hexbug]